MTSNTLKYTSVVTFALSLYANVRYLAGRAGHDIDDPEKDPYYRVGYTPFTANILVVLIYWGVTHFLQLAFVARYFFPEASNTDSHSSNPVTSAFGGAVTVARSKVADAVGRHFNVFNFLHFLWLLLFVSGHYILSELVIIVNLFNVVAMYTSQKTYNDTSIAHIFFIHMPVVALPFSWLMYALFWNGAVVVDSHSLAARIVANVFIWDFLLVPTFFLAIYRDWSVGISSAALMLAVGLSQLFTKVFALQWIFAFTISGFLFLASLAVMGATAKESTTASDAENAPLINN